MRRQSRWVATRAAPTAAAALLALLASLGWAPDAQARRNGFASSGCEGCHSGGRAPTVTLTATPTNPAAGQTVTLTIGVTQTNGPAAGFFLTLLRPAGTFRAIQPGTSVSEYGATHTTPRLGTGGVTTFQIEWSSPQPAGAQFQVFAVSANNDGSSRGDGAGSANLSITAGCAGSSYYLDQDADGYGTNDPAFPVARDCAPPAGYAPMAGDCDDFHASVHPGAPELCDGKDNNCDGRADETVTNQTYCEDKDGDGHGVAGATTKVDCVPPAGFGDCKGDCNDNNAAIYPGAPETCDNRDNNCDGRTDEGARMTCGEGWCRRYAVACTSQCTPGIPMRETCNFFDDDCDGVADNGTDLDLCGAPGLTCLAGTCVPGSSSGGGGGGGSSGGASGGSAGVTGGGGAAGGGSDSPGAAGGCAVGQGRAASSGAAGALVALALVAGAIARRRRRGPAVRPRSGR